YSAFQTSVLIETSGGLGSKRQFAIFLVLPLWISALVYFTDSELGKANARFPPSSAIGRYLSLVNLVPIAKL
ncbi:MAG: hypothetical protein V7750_17230, partial [Sneathiella sp.]